MYPPPPSPASLPLALTPTRTHPRHAWTPPRFSALSIGAFRYRSSFVFPLSSRVRAMMMRLALSKGGRCDDQAHYMLQGMCLKCTPYVEYLLSIAGTLVIVVREHSRLALPSLSNFASLCAWNISQPPAVLELVHACKRMHHAHERPRSKHAKEKVMTLARAPYLFRILVPANDLEACGHPPCSQVWTFFKLRSVWMGRYTLPASCMTPPAWRAHEIVSLRKVQTVCSAAV